MPPKSAALKRKVWSVTARCRQGDWCAVCGAEVENLADFDYYLRHILGEVDPDLLAGCDERHRRCDPVLALFIVAPRFMSVQVEGPFSNKALAPEFVTAEEVRIARGSLRLREVFALGLPTSSIPWLECGHGVPCRVK